MAREADILRNFSAAVADLPPRPALVRDRAAQAEHFVQFYLDEKVLTDSVTTYVRRSLRDGAATILIATAAHIEALKRCWETEGFDVVGSRSDDRLLLLDAEQSLALFMRNGTPDRERFLATVGKVIGEAVHRHGRVAAFGEMVALLWKQGQMNAAVQLEQLWNELAISHAFTLFCAYPIQHCSGHQHIEPFQAVCASHTRVIPAENAADLTPPEQGKLIAQLQQKALVLEGKLEQEVHTQRALRQAHAELQSRTAEMARFNQAAVGREMRLIELKREVNALREELGRGVRYSLDFENDAPRSEQEPPDVTDKGLVPLEAILCTELLYERRPRAPDHEAENLALTALMEALADSPRTVLQVLSQKVLELLHAGSAGLSLLTEDGDRFYWAAIAGAWTPHLGGGTPREFGPCGDVLERDTPLLFSHWEKRYPYLAAAVPLAHEGLLVPFRADGELVGTIWAINHDVKREFDQEDLRLLRRLGRFASIAYQAIKFVDALDQRRAALHLLEDAVQAQRQAEESNLKLREREEALRESDRRKNEFLALLGHELRNPLAPIRSAGELLSRMFDGDVRAMVPVDMVRRQSAQLARLVDDLLDVGRITQGRIQLRCQTIELAGVIAQAIETVQPLLREKHHDVTIANGYEPLYVSADAARLVQCVTNLLTNAAKYTHSHGRIRVETRADGASALIVVADNGAGIGAELQPRIFDLFVQSEQTLDRADGGLGIGLSVVKRLIGMHNGEITVQSRGPGQGSSFEIRLPRVEQPPAQAVVEAPFKAEPRRVLIVDDNADAADSLSMLLAFQGHQTKVAYNAMEALGGVEAFRPDVALLDIGLPEMNGYELAQRLRAMSQLNGLRLIALTGYGQPDDQHRARLAGFEGHLVKPVELSALERVLGGAELRPPAMERSN